MKYDGIYYDLILDYDTSSSVSWAENTYRIKNFNKYKPIIVDDKIYVKIDDDEEALLGDFLAEPFHVWSKRAKEIIEEHVPFGSQFFPVIIKHKDKEYSDYYILNCHNIIKTMHRDRSEFQEKGLLTFIDSLSLDEAVLDAIPEEQRMIFVLDEHVSMVLYHEKLVKALEAANVTGASFVKVNDWSIGSSFD
jgi:hypothetical protein